RYEKLLDITFAGGAFTAVGNRIWSSTDGINWSLRRDYGFFLRAITAGGGRLIAVGENGAVQGSADGTSWVDNASVTRRGQYAVAYAPGLDRFAAAGDAIITYTGAYEAPLITISDATVTEG